MGCRRLRAGTRLADARRRNGWRSPRSQARGAGGLAVFDIGSLDCGAAPGVDVLIAARVVQGIGAALLLPGTVAIVSDAFAGEAERARAIGAIGIALAGAIAGEAEGPGFLPGFHTVAISAAALYLVAAALGITFVPGALHPGRGVTSTPSG